MYETGSNEIMRFGVLADNANLFSRGSLAWNHEFSCQLQRSFADLGLPLKADTKDPVVWESNRSFEVLGFTITDGTALYPLDKIIASLLMPERSHRDDDKLQASRALRPTPLLIGDRIHCSLTS
eukprot:2882494-Amphidinium_carterae.1